MKNVEINKIKYKVGEIGFEDIIYLEDKGVNFFDDDMSFRDIITIVAHLLGLETIECAKELTQHVKDGGSFEDIMEIVSDGLAESGFMAGQTNPPKEVKKAK